MSLNLKRNNKFAMRIILGLLLVFITLFFAWTRLQNIRLEREIGRLERIQQKFEIDNRHLRIEWARLTEPSRLTKIGKKKFSLQSAAPHQVVRTKVE